MIQKLRVRFIRIALCALTVAMVAVTLSVNLINWQFSFQELKETASAIAAQGGRFSSEGGNGRGKNRGWRNSAEGAYEARYFSVCLEKNGQYRALNMDNIASVQEADALTLAKSAYESGKDSGYLNGFVYAVAPHRDNTVISFLNCESRVASLKELSSISAVACALGILFSFLIVTLLSRRAIRPVVESVEKQKRFITDAGHELKTPLTVISANMDLLRQDIGESEWITGTQKQLSGLKKLVGELILLSKTEEGGAEPFRARFDLSAAALELVSGFAAMAEFGGKTIETEVPSPVFLSGDEGAVRRLVSILLDNAVKYSPEGDTIRLTLRAVGKKIHLTLSNTPEKPLDGAALERLFDRFYRGDPSREKIGGQSGYGIGLSIARAIAENHGGKIWAEREGERICFHCVLPAQTKEKAAP